MKDGVKDNAPGKGIELGQDDLQVISGGISDETRDILEQLKRELAHKAARAANEGRPEAADAYSDALEAIARQEDGTS
jgi:hypothetical protein